MTESHQLTERLNHAYQPPTGSGLGKIAKILVDWVAAGHLHTSAIDQLSLLNESNRHHGPWNYGDWEVSKGNGWRLLIKTMHRPQSLLHALPYKAIYLPLNTDLAYRRFRIPDTTDFELFSPDVQLSPTEGGICPVGTALNIDNDRYVYDFSVDEPLTLLKFYTDDHHALEWLFSKDSLYAWQANDANLSATQLRIACHVVGKFAQSSSIPVLQKLTTHNTYTVRWAAIQALGRISRDHAFAALKSAESDPHPLIRNAAMKISGTKGR